MSRESFGSSLCYVVFRGAGAGLGKSNLEGRSTDPELANGGSTRRLPTDNSQPVTVGFCAVLTLHWQGAA